MPDGNQILAYGGQQWRWKWVGGEIEDAHGGIQIRRCVKLNILLGNMTPKWLYAYCSNSVHMTLKGN